MLVLICIIAICIVGATIGSPSNEPQISKTATIKTEEEILASETTVEHICSNYYVSKYDTTNHWDECSICKKKYNVVAHTYTETWTMGDSCSSANKCNHICACGYSYQTNNTREHKNIKTGTNTNRIAHWKQCGDCNTEILDEVCRKEDGSLINCNNLGTCSVCGHVYDKVDHYAAASNEGGDGAVTCMLCGMYIGKVSNKESKSVSNTIEFSYDFTVSDGGDFNSSSLDTYIGNGIDKIVTSEYHTKTENSSTSIHVTGKLVGFPVDERTYGVRSIIDNFKSSENELVSRIHIFFIYTPDQETPVINPTIEQNNITVSNGWTTQKEIVVSGTENFCSSVKLTLKDSEGNVYLKDAAAQVTNNQWRYAFRPDIEANETGKEFTITVTDNLGNKAEKTFTVQKTDRKAPTMTSASKTVETWTKEKPFTFTATDEGSGDVSIGIDNANAYVPANKQGTTYSRAYTFTEEIYGNKTIKIYLKDGLGNIGVKDFTIHNIDTTKPTITKYEIINNEIVLTGNDRNATLNKEGSGIAEYKYLGSSSENEEEIETRGKTTNTNKISLSELKNVKYAYIVAIDRAGNISQKQKIQLPTYKITVNPNGGTWKGANTNTEETGYYNGQTIRIEPPTRQGYTFERWEVNQGTMNGSKTEYTFTTSNASIKAIWSLITPEVGNNIEMAVTTNKMDENGTPTLTKENGEITYRISYTTVITNYKGKAKIEIESKLPAKINTDKSELAGGRYNEETNTINWTEEIENINTYSNGNYIREIPKQITIVYENQDVTQDLVSTIKGKTITYYEENYPEKGGQEFIKAEKTGEVTVKQNYKVNFKAIVNWEDNNNMKRKRPENVTIEIKVQPNNASITKELNQENEWTYEEKGLPKYNDQGEKITYEIIQKETQEGDLEYYEEAEIRNTETQNQEATNNTYTITNEYKLMSTNLNTELTVEGTEEIQTKEEEIEYNINLKAEIANYIGKGKIKIENRLPYEIDTEKSDIAEGTYNEETKTITFEEELPHINTDKTKESYKINQTKQIKLVYKNIDLTQEKITNQIKAKIELYETEEKDETTKNIDTKINVPGKVTVKYIDKDTNEEIIKTQNENLDNIETYGYEITGKIGTEYKTEKKEIEGYDYIESTGNETGKIKEKDTEVIYYYQKPRTKVIIRYQDRKGKDIIEKTEIEGKLGDKYKTEKKEIEKYEYIEAKGKEEGEMTREETEIIYIYAKTAKLKVKYIDIDTNGEIINSQTYGYEITGLVGDKYETEKKEIPYYTYVKSTENEKGELKEEDIVEHYYRKQDFNIGIEKEIESIQLNGEEIEATNKKLAKIEIKTKEIDKANVIVRYKIKVTNKGEIEGTATILEQIPNGYETAYLPEYWKQTKEGQLETEVKLEAGESKEIEVTLKWENQEENLGTKISTAKIVSTENQANYEDTNKKDDISETTIVISIKTGEAVSTIVIVMILVSLIICSYITIKTIRKKEPRIKNIKFLNK